MSSIGTTGPRVGAETENDHRLAGLTNLLQNVAEQLAVDVDFAMARDAVHDAEEVYGDGTWIDVLTVAARQLGLRTNPLLLTAREAAKTADRRMPLATLAPQCQLGSASWVSLTDARRRVRTVTYHDDGHRRTDERMSPRKLMRFLGVEPDERIEFVSFEPAAPLEKAVDKQPEPGQEIPPFRRLVQLLWPERRDLWSVVWFAIGVGVLALATPIAVQLLVNMVAFGGLVQPVVVLGLLLFAFLAFAGAVRILKATVVEIIQRRIFVRVVADLGYRLPRVQMSAFDRNHGPEMVNRFFDVLTVQKTSATLMLDGLAIVLQTLVGLLVLLAFDVFLILAISIVVFVMARGAISTAVHESKAKYAVAASLEEIARNPLAFKLSGGPELARLRADALAHDYLTARRSHFSVLLRQIVGAVVLQAVASTLLLTLGGWLVIQGELTLGQLVAAELIVATVLASIAKLGKQLENFYDLLAAVDKLGQLIDLPLERSNGVPRRSPRAGGAGLHFQEISYRYPGGRTVMDRWSLSLAPGEKVTVTGNHGAGKSTLVDLVYGLREPTSGTIELDGVDIREMRLSSLRQQVAVVKGLEIIDGDIIENVQMKRSDVSFEAAREALTTIGLLDELRGLPDGLHTHLAATGAPLSLGQARLLMLARAIASKPRLLVLDDVLDDMDADNRNRACDVLFAKDAPWTLLVLSRSDQVTERSPRVVALAERPADSRPAEAGENLDPSSVRPRVVASYP